MDPDLALSAVAYTIQFAQHIKRTITAYHENPSQYENLISRFRTIRKSLRIFADSDNVDFQSPIWERAFQRIRDEFEKGASLLKEVHQAIQSSPLRRLFHAKVTCQKLRFLDAKIDALQRDLDLLGFFTFSNAANADLSQILLHNVQDVKMYLLSLEARLQSMERKLQAQTSTSDGKCRPLREAQTAQASDQESLQERPVDYKRTFKLSYHRELQKPRRQEGIITSISTLQERFRKHAAAVIETHPSEAQCQLLSETCEKLVKQWNLDHSDIILVPNRVIHQTPGSAIYEGSLTLRGLWQYPIREARVAVKALLNIEGKDRIDAVLRRVVALRGISHPNIVSHYGARWPNIEERKRRKDCNKKWTLKYVLLVSELMTHNLAEAMKLSALSGFSKKIMILADISRGVEYLHRRGVFRIALTTRQVMLRINQGEVVGGAKICSLWSSCEDRRNDDESLYKNGDVLQSRAPIFHQDTSNFGILMCFLLSSKVDRSTWDDGVFTKRGSITNLNLARAWVKGIDPPFFKELAKRCLFNHKSSRPSFKFINRCIESFLKNKPLPDLSTNDCGEEIRSAGKNIFYGKQGKVANPEKAAPYFERAASCGNVSALVDLGNSHYYGLGTHRDVKMGFELFRAAAFAGNAAGQVKMGVFYHTGVVGVVSADIFLATEMYRRAAIQGNPSAQFKLGCYKYNEEVANPIHLQEAAALWGLAASGGHRYAQFFLGRCFEEGTGLQRDIKAARIWYARSAAQGHFGGKSALQRLSHRNVVKYSVPEEKRVLENFT